MNLHLAPQVQSDRSGDARRTTLRARGLAVARLLSGAWRPAAAIASQPADARGSDISRFSEAELTEITPLLCRSGAGALAWWRLRDTALADCPAALELREVYRRHRLSALLHERQIAGVVSLLRAAGIEPVLIKGWAMARRYPDPALRPYGDIDLCVRPDQFSRAAQLLEHSASLAGPFVDLHSGFTRIGQTKNVQGPKSKVQSLTARRGVRTQDSGLRTKGDGDWDELFARSVLTQCPKAESKVHTKSEPGAVATGFWLTNSGAEGGIDPVATAPGSDFLDPLTTSVPVRVLGDEDHLRLLCLHLLRSGAHRPPWLCDVALLLESVNSRQSTVNSPSDASNAQSSKHKVQSTEFDWDICLGRNPVDANWVGVAVRLAHELLGADLGNTPFVDQQLPRWLAPAVLEQWGGKRSGLGAVGSGQREAQSLPTVRRLWTLDLGLWTSLYRRWDNPIRATAAVGGRFDERSRLPYRLLESAMRLTEVPAQVRKLVASGQ